MKTKNKQPNEEVSNRGLTHSPFAKLAEDAKLREAPAMPVAPIVRPPPAKPRPYKFSLRLETAGRNGKAVTRIKGLPEEHLDAIASLLRKGLGCGSSLDDNDILLQGSLVERATEWLNRAGDLRALAQAQAEPAARTSPIVAEPPPPRENAGADGTKRSDIRRGVRVAIVQKADQATGRITDGVVRDLLTNSEIHPRGIKVRLESGEVGRVKKIYE